MALKMTPRPVVQYSDFYNRSRPEDPFTFLRDYPTDLLILRLSKINALLFQNGDGIFSVQREIFRSVSTHLDADKKRRISELVGKVEEGEVSFFTAPPIVELMNQCFRHFKMPPDEKDPIDISRLENDLFDSILVYNEIYYGSVSADQNLETYAAIWKLQLLQQQYVRRSADIFTTASLKNFLLYGFVKQYFPNGEQLIQEFCTRLGLPAFFNYYVEFVQILSTVLSTYSETMEAKHVLNLTLAQQTVFELFSSRPKDFMQGRYEEDSHKGLVPRPFYYILDEDPVVLDFDFFSYVVDIALPYHFYFNTSLKGSASYPTFIDFKSLLGKSYYEDFVLKGVLQKIFEPKNYKVHACPHNRPYPDFSVLRNQNKLLMIELKTASLNFRTLQKTDPGEFEEFLQDHFCNAKSAAGPKNKGVYQLLQQLRDLAHSVVMKEDLSISVSLNKLVIYPLIIYTESTLDMAGVNGFLNEEFVREVSPYRSVFKEIKPLTLINLDALLLYYDKWRKDPAQLFRHIDAYWKVVGVKKKAYKKQPNPLLFFESNFSFDHYMASEFSDHYFPDSMRALTDDLNLLQ